MTFPKAFSNVDLHPIHAESTTEQRSLENRQYSEMERSVFATNMMDCLNDTECGSFR